MKDFLDYLTSEFGTDSPFGLAEIRYKDYSQVWICKRMQELCESSDVVRFEKGLYYIPSASILGPSVLNPRKVIEKKYLGTENSVQGFFGGVTLLNQMGLTTQMPNSLEIVTNNDETRGRTVKIGSQTVKVRKCRATITNDNRAVLQLLEVMTSQKRDYYSTEKTDIIKKYIKDNNILQKDISKYLAYYPSKTAKNLLETGVVYAAL